MACGVIFQLFKRFQGGMCFLVRAIVLFCRFFPRMGFRAKDFLISFDRKGSNFFLLMRLSPVIFKFRGDIALLPIKNLPPFAIVECVRFSVIPGAHTDDFYL